MSKNSNFDFYSFNLEPEQSQPKQPHGNDHTWNPNGSPYGAPTEQPQQPQQPQRPRNEYGNNGSNIDQPYRNPYQGDPQNGNPYQIPYQVPVDVQPELTEEERANVRAARRAYSRTGWGFSAMIGVWYVGAYLIAFVLLALSAHLPAELAATLDALSGSVPLYLFGIPVLLLVTFGVKRELPQKQSFGFGSFMFAVCAAFTAMLAGSMIGTQIDSILSSLFNNDSVDIVGAMLSDVPLWATILLTAVCAPVFEELIFRRILIPRLLPYGEGMAIFMSALLFGLMHGNFQQVFYATLVGLVLGYVYVRSGKWWLCVVLHATFNVIGGIVPLLVQNMISPELLDAIATITFESAEELAAFGSLVMDNLLGLLLLLLYDLVVYGAAITGLVLLIKNRRRLHLEPRSCQLPRGYKKGPAFGNPGIIFSLCLCGVLFMLSLATTYMI